MNVPIWNENSKEEWLTPEQAGELIPGKLGAAAMRKWLRAGKLPEAIQLPNGHWRIPASAVVALYENPGGRRGE